MLAATTKFAGIYSVGCEKVEIPNQCAITDDEEQHVMALARQTLLHAAGVSIEEPHWQEGAFGAYPVHFAFRIRGRHCGEGIGLGQNTAENIKQAVHSALTFYYASETVKNLDATSSVSLVGRVPPNQASEFTAIVPNRVDLPSTSIAHVGIELTLFYRAVRFPIREAAELKNIIKLGIHGLGMYRGKRWTLFSSLAALIHNYRHESLLQRLSESMGARSDAYKDRRYELFYCDTVQLVQPSEKVRCALLFRGDRLILIEDVGIESVRVFRDGMGKWLLKSLREDGRLEYKYMPSRGEYSSANNMIRQFMATQAFAELYRCTEQEEYAVAWRKNAKFNLENYFVADKDYGFIYYDGKAKLGAAACAMMALQDGPEAIRYQDVVSRLRNLILHLSERDGSFRTFLIPPERNDNQNFYSGEALLALAKDLARDWDDRLNARIYEGLKYYMPFHRSQRRNTAFVPWHTMAYWHMFRLTGMDEYREAIFELNDWLVCIQNIELDAPQDILGRFFVNRFAYNGPPHSSSTAVYVEGLCYAYDLARETGNVNRAQAYLKAIRFGLRSLLQLQYRSENSFYLHKKSRVIGGLRTTVINNQMRCDNTQHAVMAASATLRFLSQRELLHACELGDAFRRESLKRLAPSVM